MAPRWFDLRACTMRTAFAAVALMSPFANAIAASIAITPLNQPGIDSLAFTIDSVATSTSTSTFNRYRISDGAVSLMASTALPISNLVVTDKFERHCA